MKKLLKTLVAGAMFASTAMPASAGEFNGWELGGAFVGGLIIGDMLNNNHRHRYYAPPPVYYQPYPQQYYQPYHRPHQHGAPRWAGPRYCETMLYYDAWGNLVRSKNCYR